MFVLMMMMSDELLCVYCVGGVFKQHILTSSFAGPLPEQIYVFTFMKGAKGENVKMILEPQGFITEKRETVHAWFMALQQVVWELLLIVACIDSCLYDCLHFATRFVCVSVCLCVCVSVCLCVCVCICACVCACVCVNNRWFFL